jgi:hypothetical protein
MEIRTQSYSQYNASELKCEEAYEWHHRTWKINTLEVKFHDGFCPSENVHIMNTHIWEFGMWRYNLKLLTRS